MKYIKKNEIEGLKNISKTKKIFLPFNEEELCSDNSIIFRDLKNNDKIIFPGFEKGRKTVKKIFQEKKIGVKERKSFFCIEYKGNIIYCDKLSEHIKFSEISENYLMIDFFYEKNCF